MPSKWTKLRVALNPVAKRFNQYTAYTIGEDELIGTLEKPIDDVRRYLRENGYSPQFLSAAKKHPATGQPHDLSYRRVPNQHPPAAKAKRLGRLFSSNQCQYHVHVFAVGDGSELFSHYEARPDPFSPSIDLERLSTHYRPVWGRDYLEGVTDLEL